MARFSTDLHDRRTELGGGRSRGPPRGRSRPTSRPEPDRGMIGGVPGPLTIKGSVVIPEAELSWRFSRSSGPGGQGVNTTDSRVELSYDVERSVALPPALRARALERLAGRLVDGVLTIAASEYRSQLRNRKPPNAVWSTRSPLPSRRPRAPRRPIACEQGRRTTPDRREETARADQATAPGRPGLRPAVTVVAARSNELAPWATVETASSWAETISAKSKKGREMNACHRGQAPSDMGRVRHHSRWRQPGLASA